MTLPAGQSRLRYAVSAQVRDELDDEDVGAAEVSPEQLPAEALLFALPSRFCPSDELADAAWDLFGQVEPGWTRVQAICDWVHHEIAFGYGSSTPNTTAADVLRDRKGVCRDFTHLAVTFSRAMNIPARYVFGYLPDIDGPTARFAHGLLRMDGGVPRRPLVDVRPPEQPASDRSGPDRSRPRRCRRRDGHHLRSEPPGVDDRRSGSDGGDMSDDRHQRRSDGALLAGSSTTSLTQHARYDYSAPVTRLRQRLVLVPRARHGGQRRLRWTVSVEGVEGDTVTTTKDTFGNLVVCVDAPVVASWIRFSVRSEVRTTSVEEHWEPPDRRYLASTSLTAPDDRIAALASGAVDAATVCARVHAAFTYEWGVTGVHTSASSALEGGRGVCQDYAHVMVAACRHAGLPARYVSGHLLGEGGSHAWVEVLSPHHQRNSWLVEAWDPTHNTRADHRYVTIAVGRDYADVAPLAGTFDGDGVTGSLTTGKRAARAGRSLL